MKNFIKFLKEDGVLDTIATTSNKILNPIRRKLGVATGSIPNGEKEVDYGGIAKTITKTVDTAMSGFGGADPGKKNISEPKKTSSKIQDRVPQEVPRSNLDKAPERKDSVALQRQKAGDKPPSPQSPQDKLNMMRMKGDVEHERFKKKMDADFKAAQQAKQNKKLAPASNDKSPTKSAVKIGDSGVKKTTNKIEPKTETPPKPKLKPANLNPKKETFAQAFKRNREEGKKSFWHNGKMYNTKVKKG